MRPYTKRRHTEALVDVTVRLTDGQKPDLNLIENTLLDETLYMCYNVSILVLSQTVVGLKKELTQQLSQFLLLVKHPVHYRHNVIDPSRMVVCHLIKPQIADRGMVQSFKNMDASTVPSLLLLCFHRPRQRTFCLVSTIDNDGKIFHSLIRCQFKLLPILSSLQYYKINMSMFLCQKLRSTDSLVQAVLD